jgi:hypothetical protein
MYFLSNPWRNYNLAPSPPPSRPNFFGCESTGLGFQVEEVTEQVEMGLDAQKSFTKVNKDIDVENGIRG